RSKGQIVWIAQLSRLFARLAPAADQFPLGGEDLDAMIAGIRHVKMAIGPESQSTGTGKLSGFAARAAPAAKESALAIELGDALVLAEFRHIVVARAILDHIADIAPFPR